MDVSEMASHVVDIKVPITTGQISILMRTCAGITRSTNHATFWTSAADRNRPEWTWFIWHPVPDEVQAASRELLANPPDRHGQV